MISLSFMSKKWYKKEVDLDDPEDLDDLKELVNTGAPVLLLDDVEDAEEIINGAEIIEVPPETS